MTTKKRKPGVRTTTRWHCGTCGTTRWHCGTCGEVSKSFAAAERHADTHSGARIETVLKEPES